MDNFLLDRVNNHMAYGIYFEEDESGGFLPPLESFGRVTENSIQRITENGIQRVTE